MSNPRFIHLHLHTEYSLVDSIVGIKPLVHMSAANKMPAVAVTDQSNLFAMVKFYTAAQAAGIKPIIGADIWVGNAPYEKKPYRLVLLCQNIIGYKYLMQLISRAYLEGQQTGIPLVQKNWLKQMNEGLIAVSGAREGEIGQAILANQRVLAESLASEWADLFTDRFYIELQRTGREHEAFYNQAALEIASHKQIPVVATNDVRFLAKSDFEAHEARVCIQEGFVLDDHRRRRHYSEQQYLRTEEEMVALFADVPQALENTVEIAKRCNLELTLNKTFLPNFPVQKEMTADEFFQSESREGLARRLKDLPNAEVDLYQTRLNVEIKTIQQMGFPSYFLIVADFISWAKNNGIPVGPGRGSGAGSLVAYALGITELDPIQHDLLFERFLNPERVSMPDFDIDFCMEGRDRVIDYVAQKYGRASVAQIITYGRMAARAVVRDVGRVLAYPYGFVDKIAKLIPFELGMTLIKALKDEPQLASRYEREEEVKTLINLGMKLEGIPRSAGKHAGGVVIAPSVLTDFTALYCEPGEENCVTQLDKNDVEHIGLVKFDFLGLRTLTIMDWAVYAINERRKKQNELPIELNKLPLDDKATFDLLKTCETTAIFQLESRGIKDLIRRLQPGCFDDIVALVALYRPGPLQSGMVEDFINRKHGRAKVENLHPSLEPILRPTYGVILYQEQVMQIAQVMGGYTLGGADILRRAMGKKKTEEMAKQRVLFVSGAEHQGISPVIANQVFNLMEMFADYGFNKSHSAAYALITYQTAWLKAHYPAEFMAAVLSSDMDHTDKVVRFLEDAKKMGLTIIPPDINTGHYPFTVSDKGEILYGLGAIKGMGQAIVENIVSDRTKKGAYPDLFAFCQRLDTCKVNRKVLEALIRAGGMDSFQINRAVLMASVDAALRAAEQHSRSRQIGQTDLFGNEIFDESMSANVFYAAAKPWSEEERLLGEKAVLGWYVTGHPITRHEGELMHFTTSISQLRPARDRLIVIAGYVTQIRKTQTKSGRRAVFLMLDDKSGRIEIAVFSEVYENARELLVKDQLVIAEGEVSFDDYAEQNKFIARQVYNLSQAREKYAKYLHVSMHQKELDASLLSALKKNMLPFCGGSCPVVIEYIQEAAAAHVQLGDAWRLKPTDEALTALRSLVDVKVRYQVQAYTSL